MELYYSEEWVEIYAPFLKDIQKISYIYDLLEPGDTFTFSNNPEVRIQYPLPMDHFEGVLI